MQRSQPLILFRLLLTDQAADTELCEKVESPSSDDEVVAVSSVGIVVIEDGFDRFGRFADSPEGFADVGASVCEGGEEFDALRSKGSSTVSW